MTGTAAVWLTLAGMVVVTYLTRLGGYSLVRLAPPRGRWREALAATPGALLVALVAPALVGGGPTTLIAAAVTVLVALRAPAPLALGAGIATAALSRLIV
jgi:uncharacterized membrane protein